MLNKDNIQFKFLIFVFSFLFLGFLGLAFYFGQIPAWALNIADYSKVDGDPLSIADWNRLADDFLARSGDTMEGNLDINNNRIINVANSNNQTDAVNKSQVEGTALAAGGGTVFVNWGRQDCPVGYTELYQGIAFGALYNDFAGSSDIMCLDQAGAAGEAAGNSYLNNVYPLITSRNSSTIPPDFAIRSFIKCAVCYADNAACFTHYGDWSCSGSFNTVYEGYLLGTHQQVASYFSSRERKCVNRNFDSATIGGTSPSDSDALMHGTRIGDNFGLTAAVYSTTPDKNFVRCSICCN